MAEANWRSKKNTSNIELITIQAKRMFPTHFLPQDASNSATERCWWLYTDP